MPVEFSPGDDSVQLLPLLLAMRHNHGVAVGEIVAHKSHIERFLASQLCQDGQLIRVGDVVESLKVVGVARVVVDMKL